MKYRKKPVVIEAFPACDLLKYAATGWKRLPECVVKQYDVGNVMFFNDPVPYISIHTLEGTLRAEKTDMVICGVKGELYSCKPDIFEATYEKAEESAVLAQTGAI